MTKPSFFRRKPAMAIVVVLLASAISLSLSGFITPHHPPLLERPSMASGELKNMKPQSLAPIGRLDSASLAADHQVAKTSLAPTATVDPDESSNLLLATSGIASTSAASAVVPVDPGQTRTILSFNGLSQGQFPAPPPNPANPTPPDGGTVAAGSRYLMEVANLEYAIYDKTNRMSLKLNGAGTLASLFGIGNDLLSDPFVIYDSSASTWFITVMDVTSDSVLIGVSTNVDPSILTSEYNQGCWNGCPFGLLPGDCPDQPFIGLSSDKLVLKANIYPSSCTSPWFGCIPLNFCTTGEIFVYSKNQLISGVTASSNSFGPDDDLFGAYPLQTGYQSTAYAVQHIPSSTPTDLAGDDGKILTFTGTPPFTSMGVTGFESPAPDPQKGDQPGLPGSIDTGDDNHILTATFCNFGGCMVNGSPHPDIWLGYNSHCKIAGIDPNDESCIHLALIDTISGDELQDCDVGLPFTSVYYPALSLNRDGNLVVEFGFSSSTLFPSLAATGQLVGAPACQSSPDSLTAYNVIVQGTAAVTTGMKDGVVRYGDYFSAARDDSLPSGDVWVGGEYGTGGGSWGTYVGLELTGNPPLDKTSIEFTGIPPSSLYWGQSISISGKLVDLDNLGLPVSGATIIFTGTGAANLPALSTTDSNGVFYEFGSAPLSVSSGWVVQASVSFANDQFLAPFSTTLTFDTVRGPTYLTLHIVGSRPPGFPSFYWGDQVTVTGQLTGYNYQSLAGFNNPIAGAFITFDGGPNVLSTGLPTSVTTDPNGEFQTDGTAGLCQVCVLNGFTYLVGRGLTIQAHFAGDSLLEPSDSYTVAYNTLAHPTSMVLSPNPASVKIGTEISLTAGVKDAVCFPILAGPSRGQCEVLPFPPGTVSWSDGGAGGSFSNNGSCTLTVIAIPLPPYTKSNICQIVYTPPVSTAPVTITATYAGDSQGLYSGTAASMDLSVTQRTSTITAACTPANVPVNAPTTCTATLTDSDVGTPIAPAGTVGFGSNAAGIFTPTHNCTLNPSSSSVSTCSVTYTPSPGSEGTHTFNATYSGDTAHLPSRFLNGFSITVTQRSSSTTITCTPNPVLLNGTATCTVTVSDTSPGTALTPTGMITFTSTGSGTFSPTTCTLVAGTCFVTYNPTSVNFQTISARYSGDLDHFAGSPASFALHVIYQFSGIELPMPNAHGSYGGHGLKVTFQLTDANGNFVSTATARIWVDSLAQAGQPVGSSSNSATCAYINCFKYDPTNVPPQYMFNLDISNLSGVHTIFVTLDDGTTYYTAVNIG